MDDIPIKAIIIHPEVEALNAEIERLHTELSALILEHDQLLMHECKRIEMEYMLTIGAIEHRAYQLECDVLRLKRKVELIQARLNRREAVDLRQIEDTLDAEFIQYREKLAEQIAKLTDAMKRHRAGVLSDSDAARLERLYRLVMKALHPDLHPGQSGDHQRFFLLAVEAYEQADLASLEAIFTIVGDPSTLDGHGDALPQLQSEKERLNAVLARLRQDINDIKSRLPYILREYLDSPEKAAARTREIEARITTLSETKAAFTRRLEFLLGPKI